MAVATTSVDDLTLSLTQEIRINASVDTAFAALLEQMGPLNQTPDGNPLPMKLEPWPGGRWYRDLGDDNGHLWGHVQAIKRPGLVEITGPLFMSYAVTSNVQYRLTETDGETLLTLRQSALGVIPDEHRTGMAAGWKPLLDRVKAQAEAG